MTVIWSGITEEGATVPIQVDTQGRVVATASVDPFWQSTDGGLIPVDITQNLYIGGSSTNPLVSLNADGSCSFTGPATGPSTTSSSTPTTLATKDYVDASSGGGGGGAPIGSIVMWPTSTIPADWLECNGSTVPSQYTDLISLIGTSVPDLRGEFVRGWDHGRGVDTGRSLLTTQSDEFESHTHVQNAHSHGLDDLAQFRSGARAHVDDENRYTVQNLSIDETDSETAINQNTGGVETRPRNVSLVYIIRAA